MQPPTTLVPPALRGGPNLGRGRLTQVAVESTPVRHDRLGADGAGGAAVQDLFECRRVISAGLRGLLGYLLETHHFIGAATGQLAEFGEIGYPFGKSGVDQPVAHSGGRQEAPCQFRLVELAAALPILLWLDMFGQTEDSGAVVAHRETDLSVETGIKVGKRLGIGLVERVLETPSVPPGRPAAVHMLVDQRHLANMLRQSGLRHRGHRLQAIRNLSASAAGSRSP